jgi:hypothetical protein
MRLPAGEATLSQAAVTRCRQYFLAEPGCPPTCSFIHSLTLVEHDMHVGPEQQAVVEAVLAASRDRAGTVVLADCSGRETGSVTSPGSSSVFAGGAERCGRNALIELTLQKGNSDFTWRLVNSTLGTG